MARTASWIAIAALSLLSCYFAASITLQAYAALSQPGVAQPGPAAPGDLPQKTADWDQRRVIIDRNLFHSATLAPATAAPDALDDLARTELPLKLLGTAAAGSVELSWAVIEDVEQRETVVVHVEDEIRDGATVERIERRRLVLNESGALRELSLDDDEEPAKGRPAGRAALRGRAARGPAPPPERVEVDRQEMQQAIRNPTSLFQSARILPKYENGAIVGLQVHDPKPGSLFEQAGIQSGEVITQVNGVRIDSAEDSRKVMTELAQGREWTVQVEGPSGSRTVTLSMPEGQ